MTGTLKSWINIPAFLTYATSTPCYEKQIRTAIQKQSTSVKLYKGSLDDIPNNAKLRQLPKAGLYTN